MKTVVKRWGFDVATVIILTIALLFPLGVYFASAAHACDGENTVRSQVLSFIDSTVTRAEASTKATLQSPSATARQKAVATENLAGLDAADKDAHVRLPQLACNWFG